jgi:arsenate reductase
MQFLRKRGVDLTPIPIRQQPPSAAELKRMLKLYDGNLRKLFNTSGGAYKELKIGEKLESMSEADAISLLAGNGNLVKRPFLLAGEKGAVGFDEAVWKNVLG